MAEPLDAPWSNTPISDANLNKTTYGSGTTFPSTWAVDRLFFRSDEKILYVNEGSEGSPTFKRIGQSSGEIAFLDRSTTIKDYAATIARTLKTAPTIASNVTPVTAVNNGTLALPTPANAIDGSFSTSTGRDTTNTLAIHTAPAGEGTEGDFGTLSGFLFTLFSGNKVKFITEFHVKVETKHNGNPGRTSHLISRKPHLGTQDTTLQFTQGSINSWTLSDSTVGVGNAYNIVCILGGTTTNGYKQLNCFEFEFKHQIPASSIGEWTRFEMSATADKEPSTICIAIDKADISATNIRLEFSDDGTTWEKRRTIALTQLADGVNFIAFNRPSKPMRYYRFISDDAGSKTCLIAGSSIINKTSTEWEAHRHKLIDPTDSTLDLNGD